MSRLYKKCFIASGGMHVLLAVILVVCPAFLASNPKPVDIQPITFIPDIVIAAPFSGGGRPDADRPAARTPAAPAPAPLPTPTPPAPQPKPKVKEVALPEIDNSSLEVAKDNKPTKRRPEVTTVAEVRKKNTKPRVEDTTAEDNQARERMARSRLAAFDRTLGDIKAGTGTAAKFEGSRRPGGGGPSYASYAAYVLSVFDSAWIAPQDATSEDATAEARVTIASDGTIVSKRIIKRSGDGAVDASVQRALDRVDSIGRPFPEGMTEKEHTYIIPFNTTKHGTA